VELDYGQVIEAVMLTIVLISAVVAVSERWITRLAAVVLGLLAVLEATTGTLFVATLIARLVAIQASSRSNTPH